MRNNLLIGLVLLPWLAAAALADQPAPDATAGPPIATPVTDPLPTTDLPAAGSHAGGGPSRFWINADLLLWRLEAGPLSVPLLTAGSPTDLIPGALGQAGTRVLVGAGGAGLSTQPTTGFRGRIGYWMDADQCWMVEVGGFYLADHHTTLTATGDASGNPALYVPFFSINPNGESAVPVASPIGPVTGSFGLTATTSLFGAECNAVGTVYNGPRTLITLFAGYRYLNLNESVQIDVSQSIPAVGMQTQFFDRFATTNQFHGEQTGIRGRFCWGPATLDLGAGLALGVTQQVVTVTGGTTVTAPAGGPIPSGSFPGGIFTAPSNIGRQSQTWFTLVPQVQAKVGVRLLNSTLLYVGYDLLAWSNVVRPGDQISHYVNTTQLLGGQLMGAAEPTPRFATSAFWAQGASIGVEINF